MPRATLDLQNANDLTAVGGQWKVAHGFVPGEANEGIVAEAEGSPCRLPDYDDSGWEACDDLGAWRRRGVSFIWYRIKATLPETVGGRSLEGARCLFESCIDDYGEIWINGECDRERATVQGFNVPQRVVVSTEPKPGDEVTIAHPGHERPAGRARRRGVRPLRQLGLRVAGSGLLTLRRKPSQHNTPGRMIIRPGATASTPAGQDSQSSSSSPSPPPSPSLVTTWPGLCE